MMNEDGCIVTNNFGHDIKDIVGKFAINKENPMAVAVWEIFKNNPTAFSFEVGYIMREDGTQELLEISIVTRQRNEHIREPKS